MPIDCDATAAGIDVPADALPPGNYVVYGYTYEPDKNLWTARDGVVQVLGDAGEDGLPPAVTLTYPLSDAVASTGTGVVVTGCAAGVPGTIVELSWASVGDLAAFGEDAWVPFETTEIAVGEPSFAVPFVPPTDAEYSVARIRARAIDPQGREWISYSRPPLVLEPGCADPEGGLASTSDLCGVGAAMAPASPPEPALEACAADEPEGDDVGDDAGGDADGGSTDDGGVAATTGTDGDPEAVDTDDEAGAGGGCRVADPDPRWALGPALLMLIRRRRATPRSRP